MIFHAVYCHKKVNNNKINTHRSRSEEKDLTFDRYFGVRNFSIITINTSHKKYREQNKISIHQQFQFFIEKHFFFNRFSNNSYCVSLENFFLLIRKRERSERCTTHKHNYITMPINEHVLISA